MWIRDIDFPALLIGAHRAGDLVLFVGAGASRDPPSGLPDFTTLARDIATDAHVQATDRELERPDVLLGRLADRQVNVHHQVKVRIGVPSSEPNRLHEAIVSLAAAGSTMRILTTNYDLHLSAAMTAQSIQAVEYTVPALPMGDDFAGIAYLHGSLRQEARHLVVTDGGRPLEIREPLTTIPCGSPDLREYRALHPHRCRAPSRGLCHGGDRDRP